GRGGDIQINADQVVLNALLNGVYLPRSAVSSTVEITRGIGQPGAGTGQGGVVSFHVGDLQVLNGAQVLTSTRGSGNGGTIKVQAHNLLVSGTNLSTGEPSSLE